MGGSDIEREKNHNQKTKTKTTGKTSQDPGRKAKSLMCGAT